MDGILIVNKEANQTSHDVVFALRRILKTKKIGHSGTLDPNATGVLLVLVGSATKILPFLKDKDKEYIASMVLGIQTVTDDIWSEVIQEKPILPIKNFNEVLDSFLGESLQVPPRISSIKINGKKLYEYTRAGIMVDLPKRKVQIHEIEALSDLSFRVACGPGTYVRSLCVDIAKKTNNLGAMSSLVRTKVGRFSMEDAKTLDQIKRGDFSLFPKEDLLDHMVQVAYEPIKDIYHGKRILLDCDEQQIAIVHQNNIVAIYGLEAPGTYKSIRGLW